MHLINQVIVPHPMKDLSFFLFKNSLAAKMKKSFTTFCNNDGSTSTLNQHKLNHESSYCMVTPSLNSGDHHNFVSSKERQPTLEEMILQLEIEEELTKRAKLDEYSVRGRMSCVNNSDILRSARNALNQYPRFSLDGKDAMYRSSFRNNLGGDGTVLINGRKSSSSASISWGDAPSGHGDRASREGSVVWCKPGVVARLMGLEAMPVPVIHHSKFVCVDHHHHHHPGLIKKQNLRRRAERHEIEKRFAMQMTNRRGKLA